jgi:hypothetical protein
METLRRQVRRARRRLTLQYFVRTLPAWLTTALFVALGVVAFDKFRPQGIVVWQALAIAAGAGVILAAGWTAFKRTRSLDADVGLDRRFGLRERVSSALALTAEEQATPAGQALLADAAKRIEKLHVPEHFGVSPNRWTLLPLAPAAAAFLVATFINPAEQEQAKASIQAQQTKRVKSSAKQLQQKLAEKKEKAAKEGLKDAERIFAELEKGMKDLGAKENVDRKQAMVKLNDLSKDLEKRRQELGGNEAMKKQLESQFKDLQSGPADKLAKALKEGDFKQAMEEINKLKEMAAGGQMDAKQQEQLEKQMQQMEKKLQQLAKAQQEAKENLKKQIQQLQQAGQKQEAEDLQKQLDQMQQQDQQMQKMQQLAEKCGQCAQQMQNGEMEAAAQTLQEMQEQMEGMKMEAEELAMLEEAIEQIAQSKGQMGQGKQPSMDGEPGMGLGEGQGRGERPEEEDEVGLYTSNVKQQVGKGKAVITDLVDGPNVKGEAQQKIKAEFEAEKKSDKDPLTGQKLPREYRDHTKSYFDALRQGK